MVFQKREGRARPLPDPYGSEEFWSAYHAAVAGEIALPKKPGAKSGTLAWLIGRYRESAAWSQLSMATRRVRENIFKHIIESAGEWSYADIRRADIVAGRDRRKETPFAATGYLKTVRGLFRWAQEAGFVEDDPTAGVKALNKKTTGHHTWSEDEIAKFEKRWPIGTKQRLALALLVYTGLRRSDVVRLGKQHVRNGVIELTTQKTGTPVYVPIVSDLQAVINGSGCGDLHFLLTEYGKPFTAAGFGNWFRDAASAAGVPGSAHGLRKAAATRLANAGATVHELESVFGWEGGKMASHYTKQADRARLARSAMDKMQTSIPAPVSKVREAGRKAE